MTSQTLSDIYNYAAFSYEYYNGATQTPHGQMNQHMTELQPDASFYGKVSTNELGSNFLFFLRRNGLTEVTGLFTKEE